MTERVMKDSMEIPDMVEKKAEEAFRMIREKKAARHRRFLMPPAAAACLGLVLVGGLTVGAATFPAWSSVLKGKLYAEEEEQGRLYSSGMAAQYPEDLAVTCNGVTITPLEAVVDDYSVYMTFHMEGITIEDGHEVFFRSEKVTIPECPMDTGGSSSCSIIDADHEDFVVVAHVTGEDGFQNLSGKTVHVQLGALMSDRGLEVLNEGEWTYDLTLPESTDGKEYPMEIVLPDESHVSGSITITPISVRIRYDRNMEPEFGTGFDQPNLLDADGHVIEGIMGEGGADFWDDFTEQVSNFTRVIDPEEIAAIEIPRGHDYYRVELR